MSKHTPGPWRLEEIGGDTLVVTSVEGDRELWGVDLVVVSIQEGVYAKPNARLIAAAPELLELVAHALKNCTTDDDEVWLDSAWVKAARAALAKAEGRDE